MVITGDSRSTAEVADTSVVRLFKFDLRPQNE